MKHVLNDTGYSKKVTNGNIFLLIYLMFLKIRASEESSKYQIEPPQPQTQFFVKAENYLNLSEQTLSMTYYQSD